jgi:hypothetical protein
VSMSRTNRWMVVLAVLTCALVTSETEAFANGDPASHVLPAQDLFLPSDALLCSAAVRRLTALTEATKKAGYPIKVAVIPTGEDLGTLYRLFGRPERYARQLAVELPAELFEPLDGKRGYRLLVLMPGGLGLEGGGTKETRALERFTVDADATEADLARLANRVVARLARAAGSPVTPPPPKPECFEIESTSDSSSSDSSAVGTVLIFLAPVAMFALAMYLGSRGRRGRGAGAE